VTVGQDNTTDIVLCYEDHRNARRPKTNHHRSATLGRGVAVTSEGVFMSRPSSSDSTHFSLLSQRLLDEVHDARAALAAAEHYISSFPQRSMYHFCVTHEALHEAHKAIERVIEMVRTEAARSRQHNDAKPEPDRRLTDACSPHNARSQPSAPLLYDSTSPLAPGTGSRRCVCYMCADTDDHTGPFRSA
jgi:hypothetical protein